MTAKDRATIKALWEHPLNLAAEEALRELGVEPSHLPELIPILQLADQALERGYAKDELAAAEILLLWKLTANNQRIALRILADLIEPEDLESDPELVLEMVMAEVEAVPDDDLQYLSPQDTPPPKKLSSDLSQEIKKAFDWLE